MAQRKRKATTNTTTAATGETEQVAVLRVRAKAERFHRAGYQFTRTARTLRVDSLTDEQIAQLRNEPMLVVTDDLITD